MTIENPKGVNRGVEKMTARVEGKGEEAVDPSQGILMVDDGKVHDIKVILGGQGEPGGLRLADVAPDLAKRFPSIA